MDADKFLKEAEGHSQNAAQELNSILSSISCGILQYSKKDNTLLRANRAALEILGYESEAELEADREGGIVKNVLPEDRRHLQEIVSSLQNPGELKNVEYRVMHKNSDQIHYCYGTVQIYEDYKGETIVLRTIMDITDRKINEDIRQTNDELLARIDTVMGGISGGFEITADNPEMSYVFLSESVAALQGYTVQELFSVCRFCAAQNIYPKDRARVLEILKDVTPDSGTFTVKYRLIHKNGSIIWVSKTGKKILDKDGVPFFYSLVQDITESEKRLEELNRLLTMQKLMAESLSSGVLAYTLPDRKILIANDETKRLFRYHPGDSRSLVETLFDHILPADREYIREAIKNLKELGDSCFYRLHPLKEDGGRLTLDCTTKLLAFEDGQRFILSVISDVTEIEERNRTLNELNAKQQEMLAVIRKERQQYRDALISGSEFSYRFDVTLGIVSSDFDHSVRGTLSQNLNVLLPMHYDEMTTRWMDAKKPSFLTPSEQNPLTCAQLLSCFEQGMKHIVTEYYIESENKYYRRSFLLSKDEETGHIWAIAIVNDITSAMREETRKRNELSIINRSLRNQIGISKAFSSIYFATWDVHMETGQITAISAPKWAEHIQELSGGDFEKATEMMISSFVKEEYKEPVREFMYFYDMAERLKNESMLSCEYQGTHYGWSVACLIPSVRDEDGNVQHVIFALREISNEKRIELETKQALEEAYEAANRANRAKTDFLSSVSHDIRTPMNGIIGMTAIAGTHLDDKERVADCLAKISVSSKHLLGLINEVLDMNKIESGKLDLNVEEFNLSELMDTLLVMTKPEITAKQHALSVNIQNVEHEKVIGDSLRIQQVFVNLLSNAIKYTPEGGSIKLGLTEKATNNPKIGCFEFTVEDNGIGMSPEFRERLFEPFSRAKDSRVEKIQGSGLGMPIARNIVRMMNGDITVESALSKGTKFTVTIYLELQKTGDQTVYEDFIDLPILVADDDEIACESTCSVLKELGMKGEWVLSGSKAVEKVIARHLDGDDYFAVILDWKMPGMDGLTTTREIRRRVGDAIPIIIISAYDWSDIEQEARAAGVSAFLSKPVFKSRMSYLFRNLMGQEPENTGNNVVNDLAQKNYSGKRALLVEDNELNAEIAGELLGMTGLELCFAVNGKEAVDFVTENPEGYFDIIFMDIQMPVMNGYEATRAIRSLPGDYVKKIPIIAMTANAFAEDVQAARDVGMNEHIAKPLNIAQLTKSLERWLRR